MISTFEERVAFLEEVKDAINKLPALNGYKYKFDIINRDVGREYTIASVSENWVFISAYKNRQAFTLHNNCQPLRPTMSAKAFDDFGYIEADSTRKNINSLRQYLINIMPELEEYLSKSKELAEELINNWIEG